MIKKHDWFAASLFQPDLSVEDFYNIGITPYNAEIKSQDAYKNIPEVIEAFTKDGKFDDNAFNTFYNNALSSYNSYSKSEFDKKVLENYEWDPNDWMAPIGGKTRDVSAKFILGKNNPTKIQSGIEALGLNTESEFSNRELAQANEVRDENGNKLGYTPNERGGWFKSLSRPTLVLAQYDEDVEEIIDGRKVIHKKGELKLDEYGVPYYEELGNREIYGRDVLHYTDTLSEDGSKWNKYDFFDSDGLDKSIGGTIVKTAFKIAPYFIPYVNYAWGAANASMEIAQFLPTLSKAVNGFFTNNSDNGFNKSMSKWEGYLERFESSVSDYSRDKMVSFENFGNLVGDISGQLWQQRVIGSIPQLLEKTKLLEAGSKNIKLGQNMALAYMAGTSAKETYGSFKEAGASDRTAGLAMIGNMLALNKLMQNDYFKSAIFRGGWLDEDSVRRPAWGVAKMFKEAFSEINEEVATETGKKKFLSSVTNAFTKSIIPGLQKSEFIRASISEGVEETMEEAVSDISKVFTEGLNAIGIKVTKPNTELNFGWSLEDIASRYGMAFVGGTIGGALFQANHAWETRSVPDWVKNAESSDLSKLTYLIAQGRTKEIKEYYKKLHDEGLLGDQNLSASKLRTTVNINGVDETIAESAESGQSQNDFIYNALLRQIDYIENILQDERFAFPESTLQEMALLGITPKDREESNLLKAQILNLSLVNSGFFNEFNALAARAVKLRAELQTIYNEHSSGETDSEKRANADDLKNNEKVKAITEELTEIRKKRDEILNGNLNWYFAGQGLFVLDSETSRWFLNMTKEKFSQVRYNKKMSDLTDYEKEKLEEDWNNYQNTEGRQNYYRAYDVYLRLGEMSKGILESTIPALASAANDSIHGQKTNLDKFIEKRKEAVELKRELDTAVETGEDVNKINELTIKLNETLAQLTEITSNTPALLRGEVAGEPLNFGSLNLSLDSLEVAKNYVLSLYRDFADKKQVMRSEDELYAFYRLVKSNPSNSESMSRRWDAYMAMWESDGDLVDLFSGDDNSEIVNKDINNKLMTQGQDDDNPLQQQLVSILQELEDALGSDPDLVTEKYNEAIEFIKEHTNFSDAQADKVIKSVIAKVGNESLIDVANEIEQARKTVTFSPIYDILKLFRAGYSDGTLDIAELLNSEVHRLIGSGNMYDYLISSKQVIEELKETGNILNVIKALLNGSVSGLNKAVNILRSKQGIALIPELDEHTAKLLMNDVDFLIDRINGLLRIASWNSNKKLTAHKESEMKLKPLTLKCLIDPNFAEGFKKLDVDIDDIWRKANEKYNLNLDNITDDNWNQFEETRILFESMLRQEILSKNNGDFSDKLIECFGPSLYKMQTTKIDPETKTISAYDLLFYTADIIALDANSFYARYANILQKSELAPVYGQELGIRRNIAMALNPELYNSLVKKIVKLYPDGTYKKKALKNMSAILGGAGTGKTVAIAGISAEMISFDDDVEFVYLAPGKEQADKLAANVGKSGTILTADSLSEFMTDVKFTYELDKKTGNKTGNIKWSYKLDSDKKIWNGDKKRKILIIDEVTLFNATQLEALSRMAAKEGGIIWALGDSKQNASEIQMDDNAWQHTGLEDFTIVKSPELTTALRPSTVGKFDNALLLDGALSEINYIAADENATTLPKYDEITNGVVTGLQFKYYEDRETGELFGEKIITNSDEVGIYLSKLSKLGKVAYISDRDVTVPEGVTKIKTHEAQGGEWDYVVIDKQWNAGSKYDTLRDLYTLTQRSTKGTIIVENGIKAILPISSKSDASAAEAMELNPRDLQEFKDWKKSSLTYANDLGFITDFQNVYNTEDDGEDDKDDQAKEEDDGGEGEGEGEVTGESDEDEDTDSDSEQGSDQNNSDSMAESDEESTPGEQTPPANPDGTVEEVKPAVVSGPSSNTSNPKKPKKLSPLKGNVTDEQTYFDIIFGDEYWTSNESETSLLKSFDFTTDEIKRVSFLISSAIKANVDPTKIDFMGIADEGDEVELADFMEKCDVSMNIIPTSKYSIMKATFTHKRNGKQFTIPICILPKGIYGKYVGSFKLESKPKKKRGEWISIESLKAKYSWLKVFDTWQVISAKDPKDVVGRSDLSERTKGYILENMGKVFTLASDNLFLARTHSGEGVYSLEQTQDGTYYTHRDRDNLVNFGIIKPISISEAIQYSLIWASRIGTISKDKMPPINITGDVDSWLKEMVGLDEIPTKNLSNRRYQILSSDNCSRFLSKMMNLAIGGNTTLSKLITWSFVESFHHKDSFKLEDGKRVLYKNALRIKSGDNWYWVEYNYDKQTYDLYNYYPDSHSVDQSPIQSFTLEEGKFPMKQFGEFVGTVEEMDIATRKFDEKGIQIGNPWSQCVSNQISFMFQYIRNVSEYAELDKVLLGDDYFLDGKVYANVAGASGNNPFLPSGLSRRFVGKPEGYMTDVSEWTPSVYSIDMSSIETGENIDAQLEFKDRIEELTKLVSSEIVVSDIFNITSSTQADYNAKLEEIVEKINKRLKSKSDGWTYKRVYLDGDYYKIETVSDLEGWIQEKTGIEGEVTTDFNALETFKFGVFSVSLLNNFYIKHNGNQWVVSPMKSYGAFKPMIDFWNENIIELVQFVPSFERYLSEIYGDSTSVAREVADALANPATENVSKLAAALENYLMNRILNEEC